jgi:VIT1/CCC1 family predicted Fe2+/Mn2+ transporter
MSLLTPHPHVHNIHRTGWLRAAVLGANDGIISTASLLLGIAATQPTGNTLLISGVAAVIAGALSMAAGEYVSVAAQSDIEQADLERERQSLIDNPEFEHQELLELYQARGLTPDLAEAVATQLMAHDALAAHAKDELGLHDLQRAQPLLAAMSSALSFFVGGVLPVLMVWLVPNDIMVQAIIAITLTTLVLLGWVSAHTGGTHALHAIARVALFGTLAMLITYVMGHAVGLVL